MSCSRLRAPACALVACLAGCAILPAGRSPDPQDPFERFNRASFSFNDAVDRVILKPVAKAYTAITPELVRTGVANFFGNLSDIPTSLNHALQGKPKGAATHLGRVALNSTLGLLGLIDVATPIGLEREHEDFGQTLGEWGAASGPYLVLPLFGPSSARDSAGLLVDWVTDPIVRLNDPSARTRLLGARLVDHRASLLGAEKTLDAAAFDRYLLVRDVYLARRRSLIHDGNEEPAPAPTDR